MFEIQQTPIFHAWLHGLKGRRAAWLIASRIDCLQFGYFGDVAPVGAGISELRIHFGPDYRVYFRRAGQRIIVLLCGGNKGNQACDIQLAQSLGHSLQEKNNDGNTHPL